MPQSLNLTLVHLVFSTKDRTPFLTPDVRPDLHAYLATVARHGDGECYRAGGVADHVHLAIRLSRTVSIADLVSEQKTPSSNWLKDRSPALSKFSWQRGYASFSIGPRDLDAVIAYIDNQEEHHRTFPGRIPELPPPIRHRIRRTLRLGLGGQMDRKCIGPSAVARAPGRPPRA